jgi:hypothetical protein
MMMEKNYSTIRSYKLESKKLLYFLCRKIHKTNKSICGGAVRLKVFPDHEY